MRIDLGLVFITSDNLVIAKLRYYYVDFHHVPIRLKFRLRQEIQNPLHLECPNHAMEWLLMASIEALTTTCYRIIKQQPRIRVTPAYDWKISLEVRIFTGRLSVKKSGSD